MRIGIAAAALVLASAVWAFAIVAAPHARSASTAAARAAALVYAAGAVICHQRADRSFTAAGYALPVCARCTGLYLSALAGGVLALAFARRVPAPARARQLFVIAAIPTVATWTAEVIGVAHPTNAIRAGAAVPLGAAAAWLVVALLLARAPRPPRGARVHAV